MRQLFLPEHLTPADRPPSYGRLVWRQFRRNPTARWALRGLYVLGLVALFGDFLANERPLYCRLEGKTYMPVLYQYVVDLGLGEWEARFVQSDWHNLPYEHVVFAPIPYSAGTIDRRNMNFRSPLGPQRVDSPRFRHWLGTDQLGRDVAAGMIRGARVALTVGLAAMAIASAIGLFFGAVAGYFGDEQLQVPRGRLAAAVIGLGLGLFYGFWAPGPYLREAAIGIQWLYSLLTVAGITVLVSWLARPICRIPWLGRRITLPADLLIMRFIEVVNSIPTLLLILAIIAVVRKPSLFYVMAIIGLIGWTGIARFTRAEMLRIRRQEYIEAARALGYGTWRILFRHALPNALTPVLIAIAFGIAGAILLEAFLSFLGIGLPPESVTWGTLLNLARYQSKAWWLAVFPGLAIFITVTLFNLVGDGLSEALDPRLLKN